jgi:hypothetical protein
MAGNSGRSGREAGIKYTRARYNSDGNIDTGNKSATMGFAWILYHSYAYWDIGGLTDSIRNVNVVANTTMNAYRSEVGVMMMSTKSR